MLARGKFMPKLHLRPPVFTYNACGLFTKLCERIQKFREACDLNYIYKNELDKACFADDAAYSDSKDLAERTISDKILKYRAYAIPNFGVSRVIMLQETFSVGGVSFTLIPSKEAVNCKIKRTNKFAV